MSRLLPNLWPQEVYAGLFPGLTRLQRGRVAEWQTCAPENATPIALSMALSALLAQQTPPLKKGAKITLTVSDTVAAITTLPWQEGLRKEDELHSYAQVYFEKLGIKIDHQWVLHVEFRHYGATGLAYAFPKSWLETIIAVADEKKGDIETILPISAAACSRVKLSSKSGLFLLLLHEKTHLAALVYRDGNLIARDVEPIVQFADESCNRLMLRVKGAHEGAHDSAGNIMSEVAYWSYNLQAPPAALVESIFPGVKIVAVGYRDWE